MSFADLVKKLRQKTKFQNTTAALVITDYDYTQLVLEGIKTLYIDLCKEARFEQDVDEESLTINVVFSIAEVEYILNSACIGFYNLIQGTVNTLHGYSTDALTITNADKPYANIANEINKLKDRQIELFHKIRACEDKQ